MLPSKLQPAAPTAGSGTKSSLLGIFPKVQPFLMEGETAAAAVAVMPKKLEFKLEEKEIKEEEKEEEEKEEV